MTRSYESFEGSPAWRTLIFPEQATRAQFFLRSICYFILVAVVEWIHRSIAGEVFDSEGAIRAGVLGSWLVLLLVLVIFYLHFAVKPRLVDLMVNPRHAWWIFVPFLNVILFFLCWLIPRGRLKSR